MLKDVYFQTESYETQWFKLQIITLYITMNLKTKIYGVYLVLLSTNCKAVC